MPTFLPFAAIAFLLVTVVLNSLAKMAAEERRLNALRQQALTLRASYARRLEEIHRRSIPEVSPADETVLAV